MFIGTVLLTSTVLLCQGITQKALFSTGQIIKTKATYQGEQWEPMLRFSSIGKADMELCLPVPPQRECYRPIQPGTGNTCECADARGMFLLLADRVCMSHGMLLRIVFAYAAPEWLCLTNKHIHTHIQSGNPSVTPSF